MRTLLLVLPLLAACSAEPDFDTRYNEQAARMNAAAGAIEAQLNAQLNAARLAAPANEAAGP